MPNIVTDAMGNVIGTTDQGLTQQYAPPEPGTGRGPGAGAGRGSSEVAATDPRRVDQTQNDDRIRVLKYPLAGGNSHYVRFTINVNEESRLIKNKVVTTTGQVDNSEQSRANRGTQTAETISRGTAVVGAIQGAQIGSAWGAHSLKKMFGTNVPMSKSYKAGGVAAAGLVTAAGTALGAAVGYGVGAIASETFHLTNRLYHLASTITLYSPGDLRADYTMQYDITEDTLSDLAQQDQSDALMKGIKSPGDAMKGITKIAEIIASKTKTVSILSRTAVNPKKDIMFSHVNNRQFQFNYTFAPRSAAEAKEVADIIYMFKFFAHPEILPGYGNFLYLYPAEFDIEYGIINEDGSESVNDKLNRISSCVIDAIGVNYAPNGSFQSLAAGEPIITTLSLSFKEIEVLHQGRIQRGY